MVQRFYPAMREFIASESAGGIILMGVALVALIVANSFLSPAYFAALQTYVAGLSIQHWINDGLMAIFFLLIGLEIKRELVEGELSTWNLRILPGVAALGGMAIPALIYVLFNANSPETLRGWAIPAATDIAFALGALALLGRRVPVSLKIFLTALAIIDDLGAVMIIAVFYTADLSLIMLALVAAVLAMLFVMNNAGVSRLLPFLAGGVVLWIFTLQSGVHATLAGVALAMFIPIQTNHDHASAKDQNTPLHRLEHSLQPYVAFAVLPIFAFANAGVSLAGISVATLTAPLPLGIALGLFLGKQLGVFGFAYAAIRLGFAKMPDGANFGLLYGVSVLTGIGFTMSLFIGLLAFPDAPALQDAVKIGVLAGSLISGLAGIAVVAAFLRVKKTTELAAPADPR